MRALLLALILTAAGLAQAHAAMPWRITRDHWSQADEEGFGRFVTALGESGCSSSESCLRSQANKSYYKYSLHENRHATSNVESCLGDICNWTK